ncbi:hypothetical protein L3i22_040890 [Actinoplanes sp. L3-i22]|nr:hypothetical protein L3i22_040890 [Actinoplanes sp. L3-i22]
MTAEMTEPPTTARPPRRIRILRSLAGLFVLLVAAGFVTVAANPAVAAAGCRVDYSVNQWSTGFTGNVTITNLGDAINGWTLQFDYPGNQQISQSWNSTFVQSGQHVTLRDAGYNAAIATNAGVTAGFNATFSGSNPAPTAFTLNGVACTGATAPTTPATTTPTTTTPTTAPPAGDPWNPPSQYVAPLASTWKHQEDTYADLYGFKNYLFDQVMAAKGSINYCVRWESTATVTAALRDQIQTALQGQFQKWVDQLTENGAGWNGWPYKQIPVKVVGWAVRDRNQLQWSDSSVDIYVNDINEGAPQCSPPCGRFFHQDGNYSGCPGGASHHYDLSLWLTQGMGLGGAGGDWGQRIDKDYFVNALGSADIHILLHEMGHSWGLNDFYDFDPLPSEGFVMKAGSATQITAFDKWMLRDFWRHLKNRYGL